MYIYCGGYLSFLSTMNNMFIYLFISDFFKTSKYKLLMRSSLAVYVEILVLSRDIQLKVPSKRNTNHKIDINLRIINKTCNWKFKLQNTIRVLLIGRGQIWIKNFHCFLLFVICKWYSKMCIEIKTHNFVFHFHLCN